MKLQIVGIQLSLLKLRGETCSGRASALQEQGRRKEGGKGSGEGSRTDPSHAVLAPALRDTSNGCGAEQVVGEAVQPHCAASPR